MVQRGNSLNVHWQQKCCGALHIKARTARFLNRKRGHNSALSNHEICAVNRPAYSRDPESKERHNATLRSATYYLEVNS